MSTKILTVAKIIQLNSRRTTVARWRIYKNHSKNLCKLVFCRFSSVNQLIINGFTTGHWYIKVNRKIK